MNALSKRLSKHAQSSLAEAEKIAMSCKSEYILPEHLLLAVFLRRGCAGSTALTDMGLSEESFAHLFQHDFSPKNKTQNTSTEVFGVLNPPPLSDRLKKIMLMAYQVARSSKSPYVGTEHITRALLSDRSEAMKNIFSGIKHPKRTPKKLPKGTSGPAPFFKALEFPTQFFSEDEEAEMSALEEFCTNLNKRSHEKKDLPLIGRSFELQRTISILKRKTKNNVLLIGEPGVGKTAIVSGLAHQIEKGNVPDLEGKIIYEIDLALLVSGTSFRGEFEARIKDIIYEASKDPRIILFIDEIHTLVGTGNISGSLDAANILKPALARGEIRCIGATTFSEYKKYIEKDSALSRRFQTVTVDEPTQEEALSMLKGVRKELEDHHNIVLPDDTLRFAIETGARHLPDRFLPDKAIDILDEASSVKCYRPNTQSKRTRNIHALRRLLEDARLQKRECIEKEDYEMALQLNSSILSLEKRIASELLRQEKEKSSIRVTLERSDIAQTLSMMTRVSPDKILSNELHALHSLESKLNQAIIGQKHAVSTLSKTLKRAYCGLSEENRPLGSFLLLGPSGVGKTHTAKILARHLFDRDDALIRVDMSEFQERHQIAGLIGAPAGYVGYGEGGNFTERVRRNPHSIILFDEMEKAHPDILNILLQILEDGMLKDGEGRSVSFRETIILLTSNIGSNEIRLRSEHALGFGGKSQIHSVDHIEQIVHQEIRATMRTELLDRIDHILIYHPLKSSHIRTIITLSLKNMKTRLKRRGITLSWDQSVPTILSKKCLAHGNGARSVRKILQEHVENLISDALTKTAIPSLCLSVDEHETITLS